jgi:hypothetical protein
VLEQVGNPLGVLFIGFLALDGPDIFGVGKDYMEMVFQDVENGNPVFPGGFHADVGAVVFKKPAAEGDQIDVQSRESFSGIGCDVVLVCGSDGCNKHTLMYIDAAADGVDDFQRISSSVKNRNSGIDCRPSENI